MGTVHKLQKKAKGGAKAKPETETWAWRMPADIRERLEAVAGDSGVPVSKFVEAAVRLALGLPKPDPAGDLVWRAYVALSQAKQDGAPQEHVAEAEAIHKEAVRLAGFDGAPA